MLPLRGVCLSLCRCQCLFSVLTTTNRNMPRGAEELKSTHKVQLHTVLPVPSRPLCHSRVPATGTQHSDTPQRHRRHSRTAQHRTHDTQEQHTHTRVPRYARRSSGGVHRQTTLSGTRAGPGRSLVRCGRFVQIFPSLSVCVLSVCCFLPSTPPTAMGIWAKRPHRAMHTPSPPSQQQQQQVCDRRKKTGTTEQNKNEHTTRHEEQQTRNPPVRYPSRWRARLDSTHSPRARSECRE